MNQILREHSQDAGNSGSQGASPRDRNELRDKSKASNIVFNAVDKRYADYKDVKTSKELDNMPPTNDLDISLLKRH